MLSCKQSWRTCRVHSVSDHTANVCLYSASLPNIMFPISVKFRKTVKTESGIIWAPGTFSNNSFGLIFGHCSSLCLSQPVIAPYAVLLPRLLLSRGDWGISSNVEVCEKAKHHTNSSVKLYKVIIVTALD